MSVGEEEEDMRGLRLLSRPGRVAAVLAMICGLGVAPSVLPAAASPRREAAGGGAREPNAQDSYVAARGRAEGLVAQMTLDEKIQLVHGVGRFSRTSGFAGRTAGIPRLGIPDLVLADGPNGVGNGATGVTAFPAAVSSSATWDTSLVHRYGQALGREQAGKGNNVALTPTMNILRVPQWGRSFETFSEDPHLTAEMATAEITGVQREGVIADAKHLASNNQETDRAFNDMEVPERALREIYLPAFEAAVKRAGVLSAMCAYNRVGGVYACENKPLMTDILKNEWGFRGFAVSDWAATHSSAESANAGLDLEMPHGPTPDYPQFFADLLKDDVQAGRVPMARLDDMVDRILTAMIAAGLLDHPPTGDQSKVVTTPQNQLLARTLSEQGTVLLKNDNGVLPLNPTTTRSLAVIGATAQNAPIYTGGGSASVIPSATTTPLDGIRARAGDRVRVTYAAGTAGTPALPDIPTGLLSPSAGTGNGVTATYYASPDFTGSPVATRVEPTLGFTSPPLPELTGVWSARFTGSFTPQTTGTHRFSVNTFGIADLYINDRLVIHNYGRDRSSVAHALVDLSAGTPVTIRIDYVAQRLERRIPALQVGWLAPNPGLLQEAVDAAKSSDVAVVFVNDLRTEGGDEPSLALPGDQNQLIDAVAAANPRTVVVLNTGGATLMPWVDRVAAVVEAWYPGQENGKAIASVLFGDVNPSAKLPMTFPRSDQQSPVADPQRWPGINGVARYDEGIQVGYRWYDAQGQQPLFPFGHGLSYTTFDYGRAKISAPNRHDRRGTWNVSVRVTNTGTRAGAEVAQLYVGFPSSAGEPPKQLKAFEKVELGRRQSTTVTFRLTRRDLSSWSTRQHRWVTHPGSYRVMIGSSSRDIRTTARLSPEERH
jgi:beta-glucosidase